MNPAMVGKLARIRLSPIALDVSAFRFNLGEIQALDCSPAVVEGGGLGLSQSRVMFCAQLAVTTSPLSSVQWHGFSVVIGKMA
jgi:hypothetical protein